MITLAYLASMLVGLLFGYVAFGRGSPWCEAGRLLRQSRKDLFAGRRTISDQLINALYQEVGDDE